MVVTCFKYWLSEGRSPGPRHTDRAAPRLGATGAGEIASASGLTNVTVRIADAGNTSAYAGAIPADLVIMIGVLAISATMTYGKRLARHHSCAGRDLDAVVVASDDRY